MLARVFGTSTALVAAASALGDRRPRRLPALLLGAGLASGTLSDCAHAPAPPAVPAAAPVPAPAPAPPPEPVGDCHRFESARFVFHSDPWINLHHFLFQWARNVPERQPGDRRPAIDVVERGQLADLEEAERQAWERAVGHYRDRLIGIDLLEPSLVAMRSGLAAIACSAAGPEGVDAGLRAVLEGAMTRTPRTTPTR